MKTVCILLITISVIITGCVKKGNAKTEQDFMCEARSFVNEYKSGNINQAKHACIKYWALGFVNVDNAGINKKAYQFNMLFASERLVRICKTEGDAVGAAFWQNFRDSNLQVAGMSLLELKNAVSSLDTEMGVNYSSVDGKKGGDIRTRDN